MTYFNTTGSVGRELKRYKRQTATQDQQIFEFFRLQPEGHFTASDVLRGMIGSPGWNMVPLTSIRRAITNLKNNGRLVKTDKQRKGPYGRPEYCYRLNKRYRRRSK